MDSREAIAFGPVNRCAGRINIPVVPTIVCGTCTDFGATVVQRDNGTGVSTRGNNFDRGDRARDNKKEKGNAADPKPVFPRNAHNDFPS
jgi:hypothetical protein